MQKEEKALGVWQYWKNGIQADGAMGQRLMSKEWMGKDEALHDTVDLLSFPFLTFVT